MEKFLIIVLWFALPAYIVLGVYCVFRILQQAEALRLELPTESAKDSPPKELTYPKGHLVKLLTLNKVLYRLR